MRRTSLYLLPLLLVTLAVLGAWSLVARSRAADHATLAKSAPVASMVRLSDTALEAWHLTAPTIVPEPPKVAARPVVEPAPDWSALRADVASVAPATTNAVMASTPAELEIAMSARERRALIASAREPEMGPGPRGYRPGIAVIVPGGSTSDGVCR